MLERAMIRQTLYAIAASAAICASGGSALAGTFDALCEGDKECRVEIGHESIRVAALSIPIYGVIGWGEIEAKSKRDPRLCLLSITACALTIFHDYRYYVDYVGEDGQQSRVLFRFINDKPAKQLTREITSLTNLASGQRSESVLRQAEEKRKEIERKKLIESLDCSPVLKPYGCSYEAYLDSNPAAKAWANANPALVPSQIRQMKALESVGAKR